MAQGLVHRARGVTGKAAAGGRAARPQAAGLRRRGARDHNSRLAVVRAQGDEEKSVLEMASSAVVQVKDFIVNFNEWSAGLTAEYGPKGGVRFADDTTTFDSSVGAPEGVTVPSSLPKLPKLENGFTHKAERWNSRASMFGFFSLLFVELIAGKGLLEMLGISVGNGLGFEF